MAEQTLKRHEKLISELPYLEQYFETKETTWERSRKRDLIFDNFCQRNFIAGKLEISRGDLFKLATINSRDALFAVILWGYPANMRGNIFDKILHNADTIVRVLEGEKDISEAQFGDILKQLNNTGLGLSTLTKVLYFFGFSIEGFRCLILDSRIIDVINGNKYSELNVLGKYSEFNKSKKYLDYLRVMKEVADNSTFSVDQLELFLFVFGKNLQKARIYLQEIDLKNEVQH